MGMCRDEVKYMIDRILEVVIYIKVFVLRRFLRK